MEAKTQPKKVDVQKIVREMLADIERERLEAQSPPPPARRPPQQPPRS